MGDSRPCVRLCWGSHVTIWLAGPEQLLLISARNSSHSGPLQRWLGHRWPRGSRYKGRVQAALELCQIHGGAPLTSDSIMTEEAFEWGAAEVGMGWVFDVTQPHCPPGSHSLSAPGEYGDQVGASYRVWTLRELLFRHLATVNREPLHQQWSRIRTLSKAVETKEAASPIWLGHLASDVMDMDIVISGIIWVASVTFESFWISSIATGSRSTKTVHDSWILV